MRDARRLGQWALVIVVLAVLVDLGLAASRSEARGGRKKSMNARSRRASPAGRDHQ